MSTFELLTVSDNEFRNKSSELKVLNIGILWKYSRDKIYSMDLDCKKIN